MGRKKSPGLYKRKGIWHIDKQIRGIRVCQSTGESDLAKAEEVLAKIVNDIRQASLYGVRPSRTWRAAATHYLEVKEKRSLGDDAFHLAQLDPFIGDLPISNIHMGTLQPFVDARRKVVSKKTINLALGVVRHILNLAAEEWRDDMGLTWLERAPKIKLLPLDDARDPYPLDRLEERYLFSRLPRHLAEMALFAVNTGCREQEVCQLRWEWEVSVPELGTSVFILPDWMVKNGRERLVILNRVAASVIENQRGKHAEYVFVHQERPVKKINGSTWRRKRIDAALALARDRDDCEYIEATSKGRYLSLSWTITGKRYDSPLPVTLTYTVDDFDKERRAKGLRPIQAGGYIDYDLKQRMKYKALERFFEQHWPSVYGFARVREHDLKHTFGRRLRAANVSFEDRQDLLGHKAGRITTHYSAAELGNLLDAANKVVEDVSRKSPASVVLKRKSG